MIPDPDALRIAHAAKRALEDDQITAAFDQVRDEYIQTWTETTDPAIRLECWAGVRALADIRGRLQEKASELEMIEGE